MILSRRSLLAATAALTAPHIARAPANAPIRLAAQARHKPISAD